LHEAGSTGVQEYWEYWSTGVLEYRSTGVQEYRSTGVQEFRSTGVQELQELGKAEWTCDLFDPFLPAGLLPVRVGSVLPLL
jgi:hypothetical protein